MGWPEQATNLALEQWKINKELFYNTYFTSKARAIIPAARGADADVPVCLIVHSLCKSVVA